MTMYTSQRDLHDSFLFEAWDALRGFETATHSLRTSAGELDLSALTDLRLISHRLKGTAALYNYEQVSKLAALSERLLSFAERVPADQLAQFQSFLERVTACLNTTLERIATGQGEGQLGLELSYLGASTLFKDLLRRNPAAFVEERRDAPTAERDLDLAASLRGFAQRHPEVWSFFAPEAREHLDAMLDALQDAQEELAEPQLGALFRAAHTLKGAAYMVEFGAMGSLTHRLEELMVALREKSLAFDEQVRRTLWQGVEALSLMLRSAEGEAVEVEAAVRSVEKDLHDLLGIAPSLLPPQAAKPASASDELSEALRAFYRTQPEVWGYFPKEVRGQLTALREALELAEAGSDENALNAAFQAVRSLRGAADAVGFPALPELARALEGVCDDLREENLPLTEAGSVFAQGAAVSEALLDCAEGRETSLSEILPAFQARLSSWLGASLGPQRQLASARSATVRVRLDKLDALLDVAEELVGARTRLETLFAQFGELGTLLSSSRLRLSKTVNDFETSYLNPSLDAVAAPATPETRPGSRALQAQVGEQFAALEFDTYSDLNILARSVAEMASDLTEVQTQFSRVERALFAEQETLQALTRSLRNDLGSARRVPLGTLFRRLRYLLKPSDAKTYQLSFSGEAIELDAFMIEALTDPLSHLVRNAIVHGIESREARLAAGKAAEGTVTVRARHEANRIYIDVTDDGRGIDVAALKTQATRLGLKSPEELADLSPQAALELIFLSGLSTAETLSTEAGRGVGMDVVAARLKQLKGDIIISTQAGQGTTLSLELPLSQVVSEALMVRVGGQTVAFPAEALLTLQRLSAQQLSEAGRAPEQAGARAFELTLEGEVTEVYNLRELLGYDPLEQPELDVVLLKAGGKQVAFIVDQFLSIEDVVIKGLGGLLRGLEHLGGAAVAGSGEVIPILEPAGLYQLAGRARAAQAPKAAAKARPKSTRVLLVDDSVSVRKVVAKMLRRAGFEVTTANDGQAALEQLRKSEFDAVVTDLEMPRLNGYELLEVVRHKARTAHLPVIVMTTRAGDKHMKLALELGASNYLVKPVDERKLLHLLETTVREASGSAASGPGSKPGDED